MLVALLCAAAAAPARGAVPGGYDVQRVDALAAEPGLNVGGRIARVGDVDGDGKDDLALGIPAADSGQGRVVVVSGADGTSIYAVSNPFEAANTGNAPAFGGAVAVLGDVLRCAGAPQPGANCENKVTSGDGVSEFLVGAVGGDVASTGQGPDQGRAYVIDGATGAIASRLIAPSDDLPSSGKAEFGFSVVSLGDVLGDTGPDGKPDFAVGAPGFTETDSRYCETQVCHQAGRVFVYSGAQLGGFAGSPVPDFALMVDNPYALDDLTSQRLGHSLAPLADIGRCVTPGGDRVCSDPTNDPDGLRDFLATVPLLDQQGAGADTGAAVVIDGATGLVLRKVDAVDAQANGRFGLFSYSPPALGDMGGGAGADLLVGAPHQGSGRAFVIDGAIGGTALGALPDPAPVDGGGFGAAAGGLGAGGVVVGTPDASPATVHLFGSDRAAAQTICDPDNQLGSRFGASVTSLGDANGDGFDELAVGAPGFDRAGASDAGRVYLFTTKAAGAAGLPGQCTPTGSGSGSGGGGAGAGGGGTKATPPKSGTVVTARVLRRLVLRPNRKRVLKNRSFRLRGRLTASASRSVCQNRQKIALQRRVKGGRFQTFEVAVTRASGAFTARAFAQRTYVYRARVSQTSRCMGAVSRTARVSVTRKRGRR